MTHTNHLFWHCLLTSCPSLCGQIVHDSTPDCRRPSAETPSSAAGPSLLQNAAQHVGSAELGGNGPTILAGIIGCSKAQRTQKPRGFPRRNSPGWFFPSAAPKHACHAEHQDGWCCCAWCGHHCSVRCPFLSPALLTRHLPSLPKCLHFPMAFPCRRYVFPAPVEAHTVICEITDNTEHVCFAELLSPLNQDGLSGVAVALQSSRRVGGRQRPHLPALTMPVIAPARRTPGGQGVTPAVTAAGPFLIWHLGKLDMLHPPWQS